jgi:hypothetical protein
MSPEVFNLEEFDFLLLLPLAAVFGFAAVEVFGLAGAGLGAFFARGFACAQRPREMITEQHRDTRNFIGYLFINLIKKGQGRKVNVLQGKLLSGKKSRQNEERIIKIKDYMK